MTGKQALALIKKHGIVLESAPGPVPSLAATVAGEQISGSWWGHPKSDQIFQLSRTVRQSADVLVCRLVNGRITYVHRRLWPALARLAEEVEPARLAAVTEVHTTSGKHEVSETPFSDWVCLFRRKRPVIPIDSDRLSERSDAVVVLS